MQAEDLRASPAMAADQLQEDDTRSHANAGHANVSRDCRAVSVLKRQDDARRPGRQSA
jgi:hypothetical protein